MCDSIDNKNEEFIKGIQKKFQNSTYLNIDESVGYLLKDTHFKIGSKVHSEHFYYAKPLFQNNKETKILAKIIVEKIKEKTEEETPINTKKITLIGYEMYSELLLSLVKKELEGIYQKEKEINHFIAQDEDGILKFKSKKVFDEFIEDYENSTVIIIVPIASTGGTAVKIVEAVQNEIIKREYDKIYNKIKDEIKKEIKAKNENRNLTEKEEKDAKEKAKTEAEKKVKEIIYFPVSYNVLWARDNCYNGSTPKKDGKGNFPELIVDTIETKSEKYSKIIQEKIIELDAKWHEIKDCQLCYGIDENDEQVETKPLYETDKSSLTPAIIFDFPKGIKKKRQGYNFNNVKIEKSLNYKDTYRNNESKLYSVDTEIFIKDNEDKIIKWLEKIKNFLGSDNKNAVILAPCHETNSRFINMVNDIVFETEATIIHYQPEIDFADNFNLLYKEYFEKDEFEKDKYKRFYVDDSIITGGNYFQIYDLARNAILKKQGKKQKKEKARKPFAACIVLKDKTQPDVYNRITQWSKNHFAFVNINQPPNFSLSGNQPLMHEQKRYQFLSQEFALHDSFIKTFDKKAKKLDSKNESKKVSLNNKKLQQEKTETKAEKLKRKKLEKEKQKIEEDTHESHKLQFITTHKIYEYFAENQDIKEETTFNEFKKALKINKKRNAVDDDKKEKALLKVLCQYPFILYQPFKEFIFKWHKEILEEVLIYMNFDYDDKFYDKFRNFKFHTRRAVLLNNYQILEDNFLKKINAIFNSVENYIKDNVEKSKENEKIKNEIEDLEDFPIFLVRNYLELIQKNGWVAVRLNKNLGELSDFNTTENAYTKQFYRMLRIESAAVVDDFMKLIVKEHRLDWRDMYKYTLETKYKQGKKENKDFIEDTSYIKDFFENKKGKLIIGINKRKIVELLLGLSDNCYKEKFENYLWIKQLFYADCIDDKKDYFLKEVGYQKKINAIIGKMKGFFPQPQDVQAFFVVTDGQEMPYVVNQDSGVLNDFEEEYKTHKRLVTEIDDLQKEIDKEKSEDKKKEKTEEQKKKKDELENQKTYKGLIAFLDGKNNKQKFAKITIEEYGKDNEENWKDLYHKDNEPVSMEYLKDRRWLLLIRISRFEEDDFKTLGVLGFHSNEDLSEHLLPKQLLMLLRRDMGKFIEKHHKNDEFAEFIREKEKADYQFMLGHGIEDYEIAINNYMNKIEEKNCSEDSVFLKTALNWMIRKVCLTDIISKLNTFYDERDFETFTIRELIKEISDNYKYILTFDTNDNYDYINNLSEVESKIYLNDNEISEEEKNIEVKYLKGLKNQLIFELFYNIRKHVLSSCWYQLTNDKIEIKLMIEQENNIAFSVSNNFYKPTENETEQSLNQKIQYSKNDGLNLINSILKQLKIGKITIQTKIKDCAKNNTFTINIPLTKKAIK